MKVFLLDTCALLWWMADSAELGRAARRVIADPSNQIVVSAASLWEVAIKRRKGRLSGVDEYLSRHVALHAAWGFQTLAIEAGDAIAAGALDIPHDDPFDRMLIVQSQRLGAQLVTCDGDIRRHLARCVW